MCVTTGGPYAGRFWRSGSRHVRIQLASESRSQSRSLRQGPEISDAGGREPARLPRLLLLQSLVLEQHVSGAKGIAGQGEFGTAERLRGPLT